MLACDPYHSKRTEAVAVYCPQGAADLRKSGLLETRQRYREKGGKSSLLYMLRGK